MGLFTFMEKTFTFGEYGLRMPNGDLMRSLNAFRGQKNRNEKDGISHTGHECTARIPVGEMSAEHALNCVVLKKEQAV